MPKLLHIEDVNLKSLAVEIKAMTVSGKQMTLAVFRQLPQKSIWDDDYKLLGVPWGRVRYFWGDDKDCNGFQVVWQAGGELLRSIHYIPRHVCVDREYKRHLEDEMRELKRKWRGKKPELPESHKDNEYHVNYYNKLMEAYCADTEEYIANDNAIKEIDEQSARSFTAHEAAFKELEQLPQLFIAL